MRRHFPPSWHSKCLLYAAATQPLHHGLLHGAWESSCAYHTCSIRSGTSPFSTHAYSSLYHNSSCLALQSSSASGWLPGTLWNVRHAFCEASSMALGLARVRFFSFVEFWSCSNLQSARSNQHRMQQHMTASVTHGRVSHGGVCWTFAGLPGFSINQGHTCLSCGKMPFWSPGHHHRNPHPWQFHPSFDATTSNHVSSPADVVAYISVCQVDPLSISKANLIDVSDEPDPCLVALADNLCHLSILSPSSAFCSGVMLAAATAQVQNYIVQRGSLHSLLA